MNDDDWGKDWANWMQKQKEVLTGPSPHIFTYALGAGADEEIPAKLACENRGWFAKVDDGDPAALKHAMIRYFEYFASKIPSGNASIIPRWTEFYQDASGQGKMTTVALPVYVKQTSGQRIFHGVVGIDVLADDFGTSLDDSALAVKLQKRSSQCVNYDFNATGTADQVVMSAYSSKKCQIQPIESPEPYIPTGATIDKFEDCEDMPWWGILLLTLMSLIICVCCLGLLLRRKKGKKNQTNVHQAKTVQMVMAPNNGMQYQHQNQMINNNHNNMAMLQQHRNSIIMQQQQQNNMVMQQQHNNMMMMQQQQRNSMTMQQQQAGMIQPQMVPTMQNQFMVNQPPIMMNQNGGLQQQPIVVQAQTIQQTGGRQAM
jgi:hypothetical protein